MIWNAYHPKCFGRSDCICEKVIHILRRMNFHQHFADHQYCCFAYLLFIPAKEKFDLPWRPRYTDFPKGEFDINGIPMGISRATPVGIFTRGGIVPDSGVPYSNLFDIEDIEIYSNDKNFPRIMEMLSEDPEIDEKIDEKFDRWQKRVDADVRSFSMRRERGFLRWSIRLQKRLKKHDIRKNKASQKH